MEHFSKNYTLVVKNNPCFINHKIANHYTMPLDGFFELILIYLIKKKKLIFPLSFSDLQIKHQLTAEDIQSEKCINLSHSLITQEIEIREASSNASLLSGFVTAAAEFNGLILPKYLPQKLSLQEIYTQEHSEILPFYHSVKEIQYDEHHASAIIQSSLGKMDNELFYNDVTVLNGVFIALINFYMAVTKSEELCLPFYIRSLCFFKKIEQGPYVLAIERGEHNSLSFRLIDQQGAIIVAADGVELKAMPTNKTIPELTQTKPHNEPIAIIGMSGRFPKSNSLDEFWSNLCDGFDGISQLVTHRRYDYINQSEPKLEYAGFLDEIAQFDARFFDISGHEASSMEPQQRLFLESAWEALEQAGHTNRKQLNCGVYLGITQGDYLSTKDNTLSSVAQSFWGNAPSVAASRIAYFLDLKGPAVAIDTACSSSLTALHLACEQLRTNDLELAIAGGVFVTVTDQFHQKAFVANMLSPKHQCHAFSAKADGFVPGEAVAAVVLKRLSQAEQDGDFIHAIIVGSGINQDGRTNGITAPNSESQAALQKAVYERFHIDPKQISYIEAHGTGTKLGDPIEVDGLQKAFSYFTQDKQFCAIGSVKSNIGHSAAAAGMSSLIKVCLSLKYQTIPVSRHTDLTNPEIDFKNTAFFPAQETQAWSGQGPRLAAINSFGFSGTNAHVVIKEYQNTLRPVDENKSYFFPLSAKNYDDLLGYLHDFSHWLSTHVEYALSSISYTLSCRKKHFDCRLIITATHKQELIEALKLLISQGATHLKEIGIYNCPTVLDNELIQTEFFNDFLAKKDHSWLDFFKSEERHSVPLPSYHWHKTEYWPHSLGRGEHYFDLSKNDEFIRDHVVKDQGILPAAAYIAFCQSKIKNGALSKLYFLQPLIIEQESRLTLDIDEDEQTFQFILENKTYCHGEFSQTESVHPQQTLTKRTFPTSIQKNEIYQRLLSQNLYYGESLKKLESISYDETDLLAHAYFNSAHELIAILDAALQATIVFNSLNKQFLPFYIEALTIYSVPQGDVYIVAKNLGLSELSIRCTVLIFNANHQLCIEMQGVEARAAVKPELDSFKRSIADADLDLRQLFATILKIPLGEIQLEKPILEYGIDSLLSYEIIEELSLYYGDLPTSLLFEVSNLIELSDYLATKKTKVINSIHKDKITAQTTDYDENCIAIIGMAGKYPQADNLDIFWDNLRQNKLSVTRLNHRTEHEWPYSWAGLISNHDYFDPLFFEISPLDAITMDPQERQFLQTAYHAFEHAGYPKQRLKNDKRVGVFVGVMYGLYQLNGLQADNPSIANSTYASIANRVSYCLDLEGPSMAIDSMCSSSLTAIHLGIQSLLLGETNMVLCGGVNLITHPYKYAELEQKSFLANDGLCHSFAADGNGYVPSEGVGAVILKRMADAIGDKDRILGVIRASSLNHGGFSSGYTVPKKQAQQKLLGETLEKSGLNRTDLHYVEAHGTGTELGDPIEFRALSNVYGHDRSAKIYLGSLKSNLGHLESAAGIAALSKVLLQMQNEEICPHLLHGTLNPNLTLADSCFELAEHLIPWQETNKNAAISSFGAGGSNAHLIVSNYNAKERVANRISSSYLLCVSAKTEKGLKTKWQQLQAWLMSQSIIDLADFSYTLAMARDHFQFKSILLCSTLAELKTDVEQITLGMSPVNYFKKADEGQRFNQLNIEIQNRISEYFNQKTPNFDSWFDERANLLELPLYPYDELRYNLVNPKEMGQFKLSKQRWSKTDCTLHKEIKLIEHCLVIINGDSLLVREYINQSTCFILDLASDQWTLDIDRGIKWLESTAQNIVDLVHVRTCEKQVFNQQFDFYQRLLSRSEKVPYTLYSFCTTPTENEFTEHAAYLDALLYVIQAEFNLFHYCHIELDNLLRLNSIFYFEQGQSIQRSKIKYSEGVRYVQEVYEPEHNDGDATIINPNAYYLVTGGSSGIGYLTAQHLVQLGVKKLILMGITPLSKESGTQTQKQKIISQNMSTLLKEGIELIHLSCALNNLQELTQIMRPFKNNIAGIIHAAGITDLKLERLQDKTVAEFYKHSDVKYQGLNNLLKVIPIEYLDFVCAFSSISANNANESRGVSSYAFANRVMDHYFEFLNSKYPGTFMSIRWPLWHESSSGQMSKVAILGSREAFVLFDRILTGYRDGVVNVELRNPIIKKQEEKERVNTPHSLIDSSIVQWLMDYFTTQMKIPLDRIDLDKSFIEYGIDSILLLSLIKALESHLGQVIEPTVILENPSIRMLSSYLKGVSPVSIEIQNNSTVDEKPFDDQLIAVIGLSGRFPGAENLGAFWNNLVAGHCEIRSVPDDRLDEIRDSEKAGFLNDLKYFDPNYFGFSDDYARQLDPLIRLSLELGVEAILNAGYSLDEFKGKNCAVLVAARAANYINYLNTFNKDTVSGIGQNFLAAHVSQYFNLSGPNYVVDSACSSSLTAIYLACQHLRAKDSDYALVSGVELLLDNRPFDLLRAGGALSSSQNCQPFSEYADGITLGEGGGAVILKRLQDAIRDGDKIEAVIRGGAINNDGQTMGITTPNPQNQTAVVKKALTNAGVAPEAISYIEAHATGTAIGDPMELAALTQVFPKKNYPYCAVGSVKSNIGHLLSAAGMASLLKIILAMKHEQLPKSLGCHFPNKRFKFDESPFYLVHENLPWLSHKIRYAGVSGFGFGGTNVHLILSDFSSSNYQQKRFELSGPQYNKKLIWPEFEDLGSENDEGMDLFFEIEDLSTH